MTVRWRLAVLFVQLLTIGIITYTLTGSFVSADTWYTSLVAIALNGQLLEPYFPRPADVLGNAIVALVMYFLAPTGIAAPGWHALAVWFVTSPSPGSVASGGRAQIVSLVSARLDHLIQQRSLYATRAASLANPDTGDRL